MSGLPQSRIWQGIQSFMFSQLYVKLSLNKWCSPTPGMNAAKPTRKKLNYLFTKKLPPLTLKWTLQFIHLSRRGDTQELFPCKLVLHQDSPSH